jgi:hypothetical protein
LLLQSEYRLGRQRHFATEKSSKPFRRSDHCDLRQKQADLREHSRRRPRMTVHGSERAQRIWSLYIRQSLWVIFVAGSIRLVGTNACPRGDERRGMIPMNDGTNFTTELDHADEDIWYEVSDEILEAAGSYVEGQSLVTVGPTVMMGGCC